MSQNNFKNASHKFSEHLQIAFFVQPAVVLKPNVVNLLCIQVDKRGKKSTFVRMEPADVGLFFFFFFLIDDFQSVIKTVDG